VFTARYGLYIYNSLYITLSSPVVTICTMKFNIHIHYVITERKCVYCAIRTEYI